MVGDVYPTVADVMLPQDILVYDLRAAYYVKLDIRPASVKQINCINVLQFVPGPRRVPIWNEWQRLLLPGGRIQVVVPYHSHAQSYAHPHTEWPPFSEQSFLFLDKRWRSVSPTREVEGLECDFEAESFSLDMDAQYATKTQEWKDEAARWFMNCVVLLTVWMVKR